MGMAPAASPSCFSENSVRWASAILAPRVGPVKPGSFWHARPRACRLFTTGGWVGVPSTAEGGHFYHSTQGERDTQQFPYTAEWGSHTCWNILGLPQVHGAKQLKLLDAERAASVTIRLRQESTQPPLPSFSMELPGQRDIHTILCTPQCSPSA